MRTNRLISLVSAALVPITLAACSGAPADVSSQQNEPPAAAKSASVAPYTGVEMFRGLLLGQGRAASLLAPTAHQWLQEGQSRSQFAANLSDIQRGARARGATPEDLRKLDDLVRKVEAGEVTPDAWVARIGEIGDRVVESITAKDAGFFENFRAAMTSGDRIRIEGALSEASRLTKENFPADLASAKGATPELLVIVLVVVVVVAYVLVVEKQSASGGGGLQHDILVDRLATDLAGG